MSPNTDARMMYLPMYMRVSTFGGGGGGARPGYATVSIPMKGFMFIARKLSNIDDGIAMNLIIQNDIAV